MSPAGLLKRLNRGYAPELAIACTPAELKTHPDPKPRDAKKPDKKKRLDWQKILELHDQGATAPEIAQKLSCSAGQVRRGLRQRGFEPHTPFDGRMKRKHWRAIYKRWIDLRNRCYNPEVKHYRYYGAKGVRICKEWRNDFERFYEWAIETGFRPGRPLSRKNRRRGYSPANCEWVTPTEASLRQSAKRRKRPPRYTITAFGEAKGPTEWSRDPRCPVSVTTLLRRLREGMLPEEAITRLPPDRMYGNNATTRITARGITQSLADWTRDRRTRVSGTTILKRLSLGVPAEEALFSPPFRCPTLLRRKRKRKPKPRTR